MMVAKKVVLAGYIPVVHRGYLQWFNAYPAAEELYVFGPSILKNLDYLRKDLRALPPADTVKAIRGLGRFKDVKTISQSQLADLDTAKTRIVMPDEDISHHVADSMRHAETEYYPVFLRWDRRAIQTVNQTASDITISRHAFDRRMMRTANRQAQQSSDLWRRVGAVLVTKDGKYRKQAHNQGQPSPYTSWIDGDPRNAAHRGQDIELSAFIHAEAQLIAQAARDGIKIDGAALYVSTFPCPVCAKLIANSGIRTLYFQDGYAMLDGRQVLEAAAVKIIQVKDEQSADDISDPRVWVPYKKS